MSNSQFSLKWDSYSNNVCGGFCSLQQNGEFVDMTLAADGHLVKVHQVLIALASPYLKQLITSAPCPHPVIFLNNVSHSTLILLLEYIYTGEVLVPPNSLPLFMDAAKALHIKGLENIQADNEMTTVSLNLNENIHNFPTVKNESELRSDDLEQQNNNIGNGNNSNASISPVPNDSSFAISTEDITYDLADPLNVFDQKTATQILKSSKLRYTVSIRGYLQLILNRYMYNLQSSRGSGIKRWRCVNYQAQRCMAFVLTNGDTVTKRGNLHCHSFHDKKILSKIKNNFLFSSLVEVEAHQEKKRQTLEEITKDQINNKDLTD